MGFTGNVIFIVVTLLTLIGCYLVVITSRLGRSSPRVQAADDYREDPKYILFGASLIEEGCTYFPDWKASMLREFDDSLKPLLPQYFEAAKSVAGMPEVERQAAARQHVIVRG